MPIDSVRESRFDGRSNLKWVKTYINRGQFITYRKLRERKRKKVPYDELPEEEKKEKTRKILLLRKFFRFSGSFVRSGCSDLLMTRKVKLPSSVGREKEHDDY